MRVSYKQVNIVPGGGNGISWGRGLNMSYKQTNIVSVGKGKEAGNGQLSTVTKKDMIVVSKRNYQISFVVCSHAR